MDVARFLVALRGPQVRIEALLLDERNEVVAVYNGTQGTLRRPLPVFLVECCAGDRAGPAWQGQKLALEGFGGREPLCREDAEKLIAAKYDGILLRPAPLAPGLRSRPSALASGLERLELAS